MSDNMEEFLKDVKKRYNEEFSGDMVKAMMEGLEMFEDVEYGSGYASKVNDDKIYWAIGKALMKLRRCILSR